MRIVLLVIDSFGIGALPDAREYGDSGANTALHICEAVGGGEWEHLRRLGLGNAAALLGSILPGVEAVDDPEADYGVLREASAGKDTTTGHWELAGIHLEEPFHLFSQEAPSFSAAMIKDFEEAFSCKTLGNEGASGTEIIARLGEAHLETSAPIVYTSADSVFQIAAHEDVIPLERLYQMCEYMRRRFDESGPAVGRVIARPFKGGAGAFTRTSARKDFSMPLPEPSVLDRLREAGVRTIGVGKIGDIFGGQGLDESHPDKGNPACLARTRDLLEREEEGDRFLFVNLVDTDMIFGHRRDPRGYHNAVAEIDAALPGLMERLAEGDRLLVTADHGCDPTYRGTDHTREHVPLLSWGKGGRRPGRSLGVREQFSDVAAALCRKWRVLHEGRGSAFPLE